MNEFTMELSGIKQIHKQFMDHNMSRRGFVSALTGVGLSVAAADLLAREFSQFVGSGSGGASEEMPEWAKKIDATGGALLIAQLKAAGHKYLFVNPSSGASPIFDAMVDEPDMDIIKAVEEGTLVAMADGYARVSGRAPFVLVSRPGVPNAMTQLYNAWKDNIPMVLATDLGSIDSLGQNHFEEIDHMDEMTQPITKWHWTVETGRKIPEMVRRALKFASTQPTRPTFLAFPANLLRERVSSTVMDQAKFTLPTKLEPDTSAIDQAAKLLVEATNPIMFVGDEVTVSKGESEMVELAELLGLPVTAYSGGYPVGWSKPFPTRHPQFLGSLLSRSRFPGQSDVMLNLGARMPHPVNGTLQIESAVKLIQVRMDTDDLARSYPTEVPIVADAKSAASELIEAVKKFAPPRKLKRISEERRARVERYTKEIRAHREDIARRRFDEAPISVERLAVELERGLEPETNFVAEIDSAIYAVDNLMTFGGEDKRFITNAGFALGWGLGAAFGVQLAQPERPVVALVTDGGMLFSGPQPLWSYSRYRAPITVVVVNNRSYNAERNRIWTGRGRQFETGRDMVCYLGNPDVSFAKLAEGFEVEAETVEAPDALAGALARAKRANVEGRPYLLDVIVGRQGNGALSTWYPPFYIDELPSREV